MRYRIRSRVMPRVWRALAAGGLTLILVCNGPTASALTIEECQTKGARCRRGCSWGARAGSVICALACPGVWKVACELAVLSGKLACETWCYQKEAECIDTGQW